MNYEKAFGSIKTNIIIIGEYIIHLYFAGHTTLMSETIEDFNAILDFVSLFSKRVGHEIIMEKAKNYVERPCRTHSSNI